MAKKEIEQIDLRIGGKKIMYHSKIRTVTFFTRHGVCMNCEVPKDWALTRILQFMESLVRAEKEII